MNQREPTRSQYRSCSRGGVLDLGSHCKYGNEGKDLRCPLKVDPTRLGQLDVGCENEDQTRSKWMNGDAIFRMDGDAKGSNSAEKDR